MSILTLIPQTLVRFRLLVVASWLVVVALSMLARVTLSTVPITMIEAMGWLLVACGPAMVSLVVFRSVPQTMAQMLYDTDHPATPALAVSERK